MSAELQRRSAIAGNKLAQYERMIEIRTLEEQINELFASLCDTYPKAFCYLVSGESIGTVVKD